jgi:hypothetical protein
VQLTFLAALALLVQSDSDTQENSLRFSWAAPSATTADAASHLVGSSCTRLNPQLLCRLDVNLKDLNPKGVHKMEGYSTGRSEKQTRVF